MNWKKKRCGSYIDSSFDCSVQLSVYMNLPAGMELIP